MKYELNYEDCSFNSLIISAEEWEDQDLLHNYSFALKLRNPAITFADMVKSGGLDCMSDEEYETALQNMKILSSFWDGDLYANIFHILAEATSYILKNKIHENGGQKNDLQA